MLLDSSPNFSPSELPHTAKHEQDIFEKENLARGSYRTEAIVGDGEAETK